MKKTYIIPALTVVEVLAVQMLAESLNINSGKTVDGGDALIKGGDWDIFSTEEILEDEAAFDF